MSDTEQNEQETQQEVEEQANIKLIQNTLAPELLKECINLTKKAFKTSRVEKDAASTIKKAFDERIFGSTWHCIIGKHFAVSVQFDTESFTFFKYNQHYVCLFKSEN
mmetsp:Transcript_16232/g.14569  ORF Transcript_16232/g.14569 Transcript_16232/m.14569 type:complete len:107 (+) Transcript_16232:113-433(+)